MTREEAIIILKDLWRYKHTEYTDKEVRNALDMAIEVLEQEPRTQFVEKSNFDIRQYNADLQNAYDCGKASQEYYNGLKEVEQ